ncbi:MAG: UDP-N-acetylglucosamine 2-epimerase [Candidatus Pacebacteria bacterium]|nr:UDP-N-acetylglucosamine 2-epimerase [Candidatus Paceibacterota bacterium]
MKKRKIIYVSGTRADYGLMKKTLKEIKKNPRLDIVIAASGMHLMPEFGKTIAEIRKDGFKVFPVRAVYGNDEKSSSVEFIGAFILNFLKMVKKVKPDVIFIQGDRAEMLSAAIVGAYLNILVVHSHGGEVSSTVDEVSRHAISKLSHFHFPATDKSKKRLIRMGEDKWRIKEFGAPGLDGILKEKLLSKEEIIKKYKLEDEKPIIIVVQHPVSLESDNASFQIKQTMEAVKETGWPAVVIYPNSDPGSRKMIKVIEKYRKYPFIRIYKNMERRDYLSLLKVSSALIGNSSSGVIEAPCFGLGVVNIGTRQKGREKASNIIESDYDKKQIKEAIEKAVKHKFKEIKNPYYKEGTAKKISELLSGIKIDKKLLDKKLAY